MNSPFSFILASAILVVCASGDFIMDKTGPIADSITQLTAKQITDKYNFIELRGVGGSRDFKKLTMSLHVNRKLEKEMARSLIAELADLYLQNVNRNQKIKELAEKYPLQIKNIEIILAIMPLEGEVYHPNISLVSLNREIVSFWTFDESGKGYKSLEEETYEEARAIVKERK